MREGLVEEVEGAGEHGYGNRDMNERGMKRRG